VFTWEKLAYMTQVSDVAPGPPVHIRTDLFAFRKSKYPVGDLTWLVRPHSLTRYYLRENITVNSKCESHLGIWKRKNDISRRLYSLPHRRIKKGWGWGFESPFGKKVLVNLGTDNTLWECLSPHRWTPKLMVDWNPWIRHTILLRTVCLVHGLHVSLATLTLNYCPLPLYTITKRIL
jgi:hypothetical protein